MHIETAYICTIYSNIVLALWWIYVTINNLGFIKVTFKGYRTFLIWTPNPPFKIKKSSSTQYTYICINHTGYPFYEVHKYFIFPLVLKNHLISAQWQIHFNFFNTGTFIKYSPVKRKLRYKLNVSDPQIYNYVMLLDIKKKFP